MLGPFLGGRRTETDELEGLGQPVDVLHQVMLHFQLGRHGQTQLRELAKDVAERFHHGVQRRRAHGVGRSEPVARYDVHAEVFGHPAAGAFSGQDGVVHRDFGEGKPAIVSHMLRALRVGVVELAVAVGIDGRLVDHVFQVPPDGRAAHRLRAAFVAVILGAEHFARRPVEQLRIARRELHVEFVHSGCKRLVVRSPKRHDQVLRPAGHLPRRVVAHVAGQQRGVPLGHVGAEGALEAACVGVLGYGHAIRFGRPPALIGVPLEHRLPVGTFPKFGATGRAALRLSAQPVAEGVEDRGFGRELPDGLFREACPVCLFVGGEEGFRLPIHVHGVERPVFLTRHAPHHPFDHPQPVGPADRTRVDHRLAPHAAAQNCQVAALAVILKHIKRQTCLTPVIHRQGGHSIYKCVSGHLSFVSIYCPVRGSRTPAAPLRPPSALKPVSPHQRVCGDIINIIPKNQLYRTKKYPCQSSPR